MRTNVISDFKTVEGNPTGGESKLPDSTTIKWQEGIVEGQQNGAFIEDVITAAIQRLEFFNNSKFRCRENSVVITKLEEALMWLNYRTANRTAQDVENTYKTHK